MNPAHTLPSTLHSSKVVSSLKVLTKSILVSPLTSIWYGLLYFSLWYLHDQHRPMLMHPIQFHSLGVSGNKRKDIREMFTYMEFTVGFMYMIFENSTYSCNILIKTTKSSLLLSTFKKLEYWELKFHAGDHSTARNNSCACPLLCYQSFCTFYKLETEYCQWLNLLQLGNWIPESRTGERSADKGLLCVGTQTSILDLPPSGHFSPWKLMRGRGNNSPKMEKWFHRSDHITSLVKAWNYSPYWPNWKADML